MTSIDRISRTTVCLLPGFLYLGIAAQGIGLQLFVLSGLAWLFLTSSLTTSNIKHLRQMGLILIILWLLGPLSNILNSILTSLGFYEIIGSQGHWEHDGVSRVPSSILITGILFLLAAALARPLLKMRIESPSSNDVWMRLFFQSACLWTLAFSVFFLFQHVTGFDHRWEGRQLPQDFQLPDGRYRVRGFYGHPLSMAAIQLALAFFFGTIAMREIALKIARRHSGGTGRALTELIAPCAATAMLNLLLLSTTGGRTALLVAVVGFPILALFVFRHSLKNKALYILSLPISAAIAWMALSSGTGRRIAEVFSGQSIERFLFWRIYLDIWLSNPVIGRGPGLLDGGLSQAFFTVAGQGDRAEFPHAHNLFLQTLADIGTAGLAISAGALVLLVMLLRKLILRTGADSSSTAKSHDKDATLEILQAGLGGLATAFIANLAHGLTQNTFYDANVAVVYMALFTLLAFVALGRKIPRGL